MSVSHASVKDCAERLALADRYLHPYEIITHTNCANTELFIQKRKVLEGSI